MLRIVALCIVLLPACSGRSVLVERPTADPADRAVVALWEQDVRRVARDGDWLLTRSYSLIGDAITLSTAGEELSHASIYDAERGLAIEAVSAGVREVPLRDLLARNRYVIVVRPDGLDDAQRRAALLRARAAVGARFDFTGMFGADAGDRFYCSELAFWAADVQRRVGRRPLVVTPAALMEYGEVVYWSGAREDERVREAAVSAGQRLVERAEVEKIAGR